MIDYEKFCEMSICVYKDEVIKVEKHENIYTNRCQTNLTVMLQTNQNNQP